MLSGNSRKGLLIFLSLLVASAAIAAPTVSNYNRNLVAAVLSLSADADSACAYEINQIGEPANSPIASVAAEFLKPPAAADRQVSSIPVKSLPPVPGALFLGLAGFLCVSVVKDRRVWLTALAGLLWLSQAGFSSLPKFLSHIRSKKQIQHQFPASLIYVSELEGSYRLRSDIEGTQYIGLLRHLAGIPTFSMSLPLPVNSLSLRAQRAFSPERSRRGSNLTLLPNGLVSAQNKYKFRLPHLTTGMLVLHLIRTSFCSALKNKQLFPFSTSFIFGHLARSPP
jgi:hypothetical protein